MQKDFYIGQIFEQEYPTEALKWCKENNARIMEIDPIIKEVEEELRRFEIQLIPETLAPTKEEISQMREMAYTAEVDPITAHIQRLRDKEQTEEVVTEIAELIAERDVKVEEIKARFPYPTDPII